MFNQIMIVFCSPPSRYKVEFVTTAPTDSMNGRAEQNSNSTYSQENPFPARLIDNQRVTAADHWQDVRLIRLDITGSGITCVTY